MTYPVLNFRVVASDGTATTLNWYPSEYLFRNKPSQYCMAMEKFQRSNELLLGGTFMRQNNIIFDIEGEQVGIVRAACNSDAN